MLHKRFYSCHVEIGAARLERAAMISAALCSPSSQQMFDHRWGVRDKESPFCQLLREFICTSAHKTRYREAYVCDVYTCIQMTIYVIACVYVWVHVTA